MSLPMLRPMPVQRQVSFTTTQEREYFKYLPPYCLRAPFSQQAQRECHIARSCPDTVLTAFAQLGTLRLNAQWAFISLFGRNNQQILAEATRTLSLQDDEDHEEHDGLWLGCCEISYCRSFCKHVMERPRFAQCADDIVLMVPDMNEDERFKNSPDVTGSPYARFLASVPIICSKGRVIGAYTIVDNRPHPPLDKKSFKFLRDMAATVMKHLDMTRSKSQHLRGERMVVGLGSFLEGKASLRNSWVEASGQNGVRDEDDEPPEGHLNQQQQEKQISGDNNRPFGGTGASKQLPVRSKSVHLGGLKAHLPNEQQKQPTNLEVGQNSSKGQLKHSSSEPTLPVEEGQSEENPQNNTPPKREAQVFSRAANIVRESMEVEGVAFFKANFRTNSTKSDSDTSCSESSKKSDGKPRSSSRSSRASNSGIPEPEDESDPCNILGFATTDSSSINHEETGDKRIEMSESFLNGLLRRYPRGKIFNFSEEGSVSSNDSTDGMYKNFQDLSGRIRTNEKNEKRARKYKKTRRVALRQDAAALLRLAPGSRSIIFSPLWDSHKQRWYSGCVAWTRTPHRVFSSDDELAFMFTFAHSIMAEIHRLGAESAERAKSDLLSSLSHELRSPLHGVFGTAELLADTSMNAVQVGMVHTIESCASTLLDTIDHLLEYASINNLRKNPEKHPAGRDGSKENLQNTSSDLNCFTELDATLEQVVESVFAGFNFLNGSGSPFRKPVTPGGMFSAKPTQIDPSGPSVRVILDVNRAANWRFMTQPGAWRLILMDILGNALKFTKTGFVYVSLDASPDKVLGSGEGEETRSQVTLNVKDTGHGIGEDFLKNDLFSAFAQENSLSSGNGLGLHVTQRTIKSLGGDIQVRSWKDSGTEVSMRITLQHPPDFGPSDTPDTSVITTVKEMVRGKSIGILGLEASEQDRMLRLSLEKLCGDWFDMNVHTVHSLQTAFDRCDYYLATQEYLHSGDSKVRAISPGPNERFPSPVIVFCSSPETAHAMFSAARERGDEDVIEFIGQPCGPRKLAKTLKMCIDRQERRRTRADGQGGEITVQPADRAGVPLTPGTTQSIKSGEQPRVVVTEHAVDSEKPEPPVEESRPDQTGPATADSNREEIQPSQDESKFPSNDSASAVLIVDDNEINTRILVAYIKKLGRDYVVAQNGLEAFEAFKAEPARFGVILMDISMPVMDGIEATQHIRGLEEQHGHKTRSVTIAALTGLGQEEVQQDAMASGMNLFLTKPVKLKTLVPIVQGEEEKSAEQPS
ncbi:hypothetical protein ASPWEDRAFT_158226 [Aspergillus wentii DTO 134E9]|uniref:Histidine kinase n=1 Tax=Aspergillus wentii DTO 134E9 TaxID=1073089 RepID=A0A1L9RHP2_ASPWE|nr:uncharacterized protein ASPWEDRAFT_158226 [Aspergillus wentii DTO 134E9]KAI9925765.1 hypothetical protein MW887_005571 [Aspergillus wentii]OJJ34435.1 hypothetical protein ASPWEDRAFT_158226 [Aspergillus wentii DTO 134E9]